jgi:hypothetical protein
LLLCGVLCANFARAEDVSEMKAEMADMKAKMAAMELALAGGNSGGGDAESIQSMKKKGAVTIGGDVNVDILVKRRADVTNSNDMVNSTEFSTNSANLRFKVGQPDAYLYIKLDLDDPWSDDKLDGIGDQDDLLEEVRFVWKNIRSTNWGMVFGKGEVPYGQDKTLGIIQSYHHSDGPTSNEGPVFIVAGTEEAWDPQEYSRNNPHANVGSTRHPGETDNVFMVSVDYTYKNVLKFEFAVFQNNETYGRGASTRGMHEDRADDHLGFQSVAARMWYLPTDNLTFELSFIKKHVDSFGDTDQYGKLAEADAYAVSLGFDYTPRTVPLNIFGEYQQAWDWSHTSQYDLKIAQIGFMWNMSAAVKYGMMYEWLGIQGNNGQQNESYQKVVASLQYNFLNGMYSILEYGYEYYNAEIGHGGDDARSGQLFAFRTGWAF